MQPVIICSAAILDADIEVLRVLQVEQFLTKPYHPLDLVGRDLTGDASRGPAPPLECTRLIAWVLARIACLVGRCVGDSELAASHTLVK